MPKQVLALVAAVFSAAVARASALAAVPRVRLVDVPGLFFGGFGAGVSLMVARRTGTKH